jgi:hypothetical protein
LNRIREKNLPLFSFAYSIREHLSAIIFVLNFYFLSQGPPIHVDIASEHENPAKIKIPYSRDEPAFSVNPPAISVSFLPQTSKYMENGMES